jgi:hypothetical protein
MKAVQQFFVAGKCPDNSCARTVEHFLTRSEQKLVDTMLVSDLIHLASTGESAIAVVSSDDDLWPGMLMAMLKGVQIVQVCTKHASTHKLYIGDLKKQYMHGNL